MVGLPGTPTAQDVPAGVELGDDCVQMGALVFPERLASVALAEPVFLRDELLDVAADGGDVHRGESTDQPYDVLIPVEVRNDPDEQRYEATADGKLAGFTAYRSRPGLIAFIHTEVDDAFEGQGVGSALVKGALDDARREGLEVLPFCPFVNSYIQKHHEYLDLVPESRREAFGL